jgi:4a-hydroxytetrahydrobiopterin dehydratase
MSDKVLSAERIAEGLKSLDGWQAEGNAIERKFVFKDFREAVAFLVRIAFDAEEADHHPDVALSYKRLTLSLSTHSEGGVTEKDFALARKINAVFASRA